MLIDEGKLQERLREQPSEVLADLIMAIISREAKRMETLMHGLADQGNQSSASVVVETITFMLVSSIKESARREAIEEISKDPSVLFGDID